MKRFLMFFAIWLAIAWVFTFFLLGLIYRNVYALGVIAAVILATATCVMDEQNNRIDELEKRMEELEKK